MLPLSVPWRSNRTLLPGSIVMAVGALSSATRCMPSTMLGKPALPATVVTLQLSAMSAFLGLGVFGSRQKGAQGEARLRAGGMATSFRPGGKKGTALGCASSTPLVSPCWRRHEARSADAACCRRGQRRRRPHAATWGRALRECQRGSGIARRCLCHPRARPCWGGRRW